jgi:hypothetical protein
MEEGESDLTMEAASAEYFALQGLRSASISESGVRASLFFASITGVLVTLGLLSNSVDNDAFQWIVVGASLFVGFVGLTTFLRIVDTAIEDVAALRAMNQIRRWLGGTTDQAAKLVHVPSRPNQPSNEFVNTGARQSPLRILFTLGTTVGTVIAGQLGVAAGILMSRIGAANVVSIVVGVVLGFGLALIQTRYQLQRFRRAETTWAAEDL